SRDRSPKLARASSPATMMAGHPSVVSITRGSASRTARRVATSRATSSVTCGALSNESSSSAVRQAKARPGTMSASSAPAAADAVTTPTTVRVTSGTEPGPLGVVERRRHHGGVGTARDELGREGPVYGAQPAEPDRRPRGLGSGARGHPPDDPTVGEEREPASWRAVDAESDQRARERQRPHALERGLPEERRLVHRDSPLQAEFRRVVVGK